MRISLLALGLMGACLSGAAIAQDATFNFEGQTASTGLTTSSITNNGLTLTVTRPGSTYGYRDISGFGGSPSFGSRSLSPFEVNNSSPFVLDFSSLLDGFSIDYGDFGDDPDTVRIIGYTGAGGTGSVVFDISASLPFTDSSFHSGTLSALDTATPFQSVVVGGGSANFPQSLYYDNVRAYLGSAVPEPSTWAMMLLGFFGVGVTLRRRPRLLASA